ncbi:MAG: tetratricopeptide repeat protein [Planctomycetes bacterium]|nr:tetratricopeptide repeat protein [Planctomycetota bacterium]
MLSSLAILLLAQAADWWNPDWSHRRTISVTDTVRGSHAADLALVEVPTLGVANPDGSDYRIIDREGKEIPVRVVASGFEDRALLAFEVEYRGNYTLYFGNPRAKAPAQAPEFRAGLILEVRELGQGNPRDWRGMQKLLDASPKVLGRWWVPGIALGFNPMGPWDRGIFLFTGTLYCPTDGTYAFATNSFDASFVLIDGQVVAEWPGWHGAGGGERGGHEGKIELKAGPHRIEYVNAFRSHGACSAGWQRPGDKRLAPFQREAFVGYYVARPGPAESKEGPVADFEWILDDDLGLEGRRVTAVRFLPLLRGKNCRWSFGDGVTSVETSPVHVFLEASVFDVALEVDGKKTAQRVRVAPARGHLGKGYERRIADYADRIHAYSTEGLSAAACFEMGMICHEARRTDSAMRAFRAALEKGWKPANAEEGRWILRLYELYRDAGKYDDAVWVCDHVLKSQPADAIAATALALKAEILYDYQDRRDEAEACCKLVLEKHRAAGTDFVRWAYIRSGELALARGDRDGAKKVLEDAQYSDKWKKWTGDFDLSEGAHSINFEEYLRKGEFEAAFKEVASWTWEKPAEILRGTPRHMRGRVFLAMKKHELAVREFERALAADPQAPFLDEALFWKGEAHLALKQADKARECFERIVREFPESSLAAKAKEKLK